MLDEFAHLSLVKINQKNLQIYTSAFSLLKALNNNLCSNWNIDSTLRWSWTLNDSN